MDDMDALRMIAELRSEIEKLEKVAEAATMLCAKCLNDLHSVGWDAPCEDGGACEYIPVKQALEAAGL